jgi:hypothetical protein
MNILWSSLDQALRDLLLHSAQGEPFRQLAEFYSFIYQYGFDEGSWRRALKELAWGRRGTKLTTFNVVRHCLRQYDEVFKVSVDPASPNELTFVEGVSAPSLTAFDHTHVNRYVSTPWGIVRAVGPRMCSGSTLELADIASTYWQAMADIIPDDLESGEVFEVRLLPFEYYEWQPGPILRPSTTVGAPPVFSGYHPGDPCLVDVYVFGNLLPNVPTTYLQPDGVLTASDVPLGGQLLESEFVQGFPYTTGPHPLYLVSPDIFESLRVQIQASLAAGVELRMRRALVGTCTAP